MSRFKGSIKKRKIKHEKQTSKRKADIRYWVLSGFICLFIISSVLSILYFSRDLDSNENKQLSNMDIKIYNLEKDRQIIELTEKSIDKKSLIDIYNYLFFKLFHYNDDNFMEELKTFGENKLKKSKETFSILYGYFKNIEKVLLDYSKINKKTTGTDVETYNSVMDSYEKMILNAYKSFQNGELDEQLNKEKENKNASDIKFVYQELHIYTILSSILKIIKQFKHVMFDQLERRLQSTSFNKIFEKIYHYLEQNKIEMFTEKNTNEISFTYKGNLQNIKFILAKFLYYKQFLVLNIYLIFMHAFETNDELVVIKFNEEFIEINMPIDENDENKNFQYNIRKEYEKKTIADCRDIFLILFKSAEHINSFNFDDALFHNCKDSVFRPDFII